LGGLRLVATEAKEIAAWLCESYAACERQKAAACSKKSMHIKLASSLRRDLRFDELMRWHFNARHTIDSVLHSNVPLQLSRQQWTAAGN